MENLTLTEALFATGALRVAKAQDPFWYTSGRIGPYYINTHFLYGSEEDAVRLLEDIDRLAVDKGNVSVKLAALTAKQYAASPIYAAVIDAMVEKIKSIEGASRIDLISGGERRDWFFSFMIAKKLNKPHLTLFKDNSAVLFDKGQTKALFSIKDKVVLHVADLITTASSYQRAWLPVVEGLGAHMEYSLAVVDRVQGGGELLARRGVQSYAMIDIDAGLLDKARQANLIDDDQKAQLTEYMRDPDAAMRAFLLANPAFLQKAMKSDKRTRERARILVEKDLYNLGKIVYN